MSSDPKSSRPTLYCLDYLTSTSASDYSNAFFHLQSRDPNRGSVTSTRATSNRVLFRLDEESGDASWCVIRRRKGDGVEYDPENEDHQSVRTEDDLNIRLVGSIAPVETLYPKAEVTFFRPVASAREETVSNNRQVLEAEPWSQVNTTVLKVNGGDSRLLFSRGDNGPCPSNRTWTHAARGWKFDPVPPAFVDDPNFAVMRLSDASDAPKLKNRTTLCRHSKVNPACTDGTSWMRFVPVKLAGPVVSTAESCQ